MAVPGDTSFLVATRQSFCYLLLFLDEPVSFTFLFSSREKKKTFLITIKKPEVTSLDPLTFRGIKTLRSQVKAYLFTCLQ